MIGRWLGLAMWAVGATGAAAAGPAPKPVYREIRDFVVACDNLRSCVARWAPEDYAAEVSGFDAYLLLTRDGGPAGRITVTLSAAGEGSRPSGRSVKIDGGPAGQTLRWRRDGDLGEVVEGAEALALSRAMSDGERLTYVDGKETKTVTLRGLKAALLAMDEAQGRLGTVSAYVRRGVTPDAAAPAPPPLPVLTARRADPGLKAPPGFAARVRRSQAAALERNLCDDERKDADAAYPLNRGEVLVVLGCMLHAYQSSMLLLRAPRDAPEQARLVDMPLAAGDTPVAPEDRGRYVEGEWDPDTATFHEASKGRGLADCGSATSWAFDGAAFRLAEASRMNRCSGGPAGDWPTVFRSKVVVR